MAKVLEPDICVIGGGAAALAVIKTARAAGASVALVTRGTADGAQLDAAMLGARALAAAAARAHRLRHSEHLGIVATEPQIDFEGVHAHVRQAIAQDALRFSSERLAALGATLLPGPSRFLDRTQMEVGDTLVKARRFVIATGSRPNVPELPGLQDSGYLTPETLLGLSERPDDLIVLGGTAEAFELAQAYLRLGSRVTVIDALEPLGEEDPELAGIVLRRLEREGLEIHRHTGVVAVRSDGNGIAVDLKAGAAEWTLPGSHLLIATGWQPDLDGLGLDAARIRFSSAGIAVNSGLRTSNRRVYAIGEAIGGGRSASAATHQGIVVTRNALHRHPASHDRRIVPQVTFTDPEIARVGLTEPEARERHRQHYRVLRWPFVENERARALGHHEGLVKLVIDGRGAILGASIVGPQASETIALFALAIANRLGAASLTRLVAPHPSLAEIVHRIGLDYERSLGDRRGASQLSWFKRLLP